MVFRAARGARQVSTAALLPGLRRARPWDALRVPFVLAVAESSARAALPLENRSVVVLTVTLRPQSSTFTISRRIGRRGDGRHRGRFDGRVDWLLGAGRRSYGGDRLLGGGGRDGRGSRFRRRGRNRGGTRIAVGG